MADDRGRISRIGSLRVGSLVTLCAVLYIDLA